MHELPAPMVFFKRLPHGEGLPLPAYASAGAAGLDLRAAIQPDQVVLMRAGHRMLFPTGFAIEIPPGFEGQVRPRSGYAIKHGITVANSPGTIDSDYRGEILVCLTHRGGLDDTQVEIRRGDRIAQLVIAPVVRAVAIEAQVLGGTPRGANGFGSTGVA
ncbi:MAG: dUTP diphosphatase [Bacteroidota bacterium]